MRHEGDELAVHRQVRQIGDLDAIIADLRADLAHFRMRQFEEIVDQAELIHELERRRMDGVAAEIAQEIAMLLQHHDRNAGPRQQKAKHHSGGAAAGDAAGGLDLSAHHHPPAIVRP